MADTVLASMRVREVVGLFHEPTAADAAVAALLQNGFDRAHIDILSDSKPIEERFGETYIRAEDLVDEPWLARGAYLAPEDRLVIKTAAASIVAFLVFVMFILHAIRTGGPIARNLVIAFLFGSVFGGLAFVGLDRLFEHLQATRIRVLDITGALLVWVRAHGADREQVARRLLRQHGAFAMRTHEIDLPKTAKDIPLSGLRVERRRADERLGL
jgi:hypothetical protein